MNSSCGYRGKRSLDVVLSVLALVPTAALAAAIWVAVKLDDRGPLLFRQERVGLGGKTFHVLKFRTMRDSGVNPLFPDDAVVTRVGAILRRTSMDELPQLWNVLRADMSIVGPRPTLPYQVLRYSAEQHRRHLVRPGLTGLAQVTGRNAMPWADRIRLDLQYVDHNCLGCDVRILWRSVQVVLRGSGVSGHPLDDPLSRPD